MLCFSLNPCHWHVVLITVLPTQPCFGFCMHNFLISLIELSAQLMTTLSNGNISCVTGPFSGEFTGHRWTPLAKASDAELWCVLWSAVWFAISIWSIPRIGSDWPNLPWLLLMPWVRLAKEWSKPWRMWVYRQLPNCSKTYSMHWGRRQNGRHFPADTLNWIFLN